MEWKLRMRPREPTSNYYVSNVNTRSIRKQSWRDPLLPTGLFLGSLHRAVCITPAFQESAECYACVIYILIESFYNQAALNHPLSMRHDTGH